MSFWNVITTMFAALFANPSAMFAILAAIGVLAGFGIWKLIDFLGWI